MVMVPPLKKAMSEPRSAHSFSIPKSGSFSHFTTSYSDKVLAEGPTPPSNTAMSREELIKKFCQEDVQVRPESTPPFLLPDHLDPTPPMDTPSNNNPPPRPDSTPPNINYYQNQPTPMSPSIIIPSRSGSFSSTSGSVRVNLQSETEMALEGSPLDHHVNTDGVVYLPIESHDSDSELTSYYEDGKISEQALLSYRKNSVNLDTEELAAIKNRNNSLGVEDGEVGKVKRMLGRLSPARSKLGFNMGSLRRKTGSKAAPQCDDNDNIIDNIEGSDITGILTVENLKDSVLNLSNSRCSSLKNISAPLPPKTGMHSKTLPSPEKKGKPPVSSSLYDIPRHLSQNNNVGDYIMPENTDRVQSSPRDSVVSQMNGARKHSNSFSSPVKNRNQGAYENVKIIPIEKE